MNRKALTAVAVSAITVFTSVGSTQAWAQPSGSLGSSQAQSIDQEQGSNNADTGTRVLTRYSSREIIKLLLAGQGQAADDNPDLIRFLGFDPEKPITDPDSLDALVSEYLEFDPEFDSTVRPDVSSGDPLRTEAALVSFTETFQEFLAKKGQEVPGETPVQARGCGAGAEVCFAAYAVVMVNGALYANVAVATLAVATIAFGWFYLMDDGSSVSEIERTTFISDLTSAME